MMPSLFKYFRNVGVVLFVLLVGLNAVMDKGGPGLHLVDAPKKMTSDRHDPQASKVERLRAEEAAQSMVPSVGEPLVPRASKPEPSNPRTAAAPETVVNPQAQDRPWSRWCPPNR